MTARGWFVAGTDTGVGKTRASCALLHVLRGRHLRCVGMKPVAAGAEPDVSGQLQNEDVLALRAASSFRVPAQLDNPVLLPTPTSPHIAAARAGRMIDIEQLATAYRAIAAQADAVVVEGAGGFMVPLSSRHTGADLAAALGLPVILVVGLRLGCLNHSLLTRDAIRQRGLRLAGWIVNRLDLLMLEQDANIAYLSEQLDAPLLADWPWDPAAEAASLALQLPG
jgi:dethiobiotin synthetase